MLTNPPDASAEGLLLFSPHGITIKEAWERFPEAMVEADRSLSHLVIKHYQSWERPSGFYLVIDCPLGKTVEYCGICVDWNHVLMKWECALNPAVVSPSWIHSCNGR